MQNHKVLLNELQAAEFLGVTPKCLQAWRVRGGGPHYLKLGRLVKYSQSDIDVFIEKCRRQSTANEPVAK